MYIELLAVEHAFRAWLRNPKAPANQLSLFLGDERDRPFTQEEILRMREFLKRHAPDTYRRMFSDEESR